MTKLGFTLIVYVMVALLLMSCAFPQEKGAINKVAKEIEEEISWSWSNYRNYAWGARAINPITGEGTEEYFNIPADTMLAYLPLLHLRGDRNGIEAILDYSTRLDPTPDEKRRLHDWFKYLAYWQFLYRITGDRRIYDRMVELGDSICDNAFNTSTNLFLEGDFNPKTGTVSGNFYPNSFTYLLNLVILSEMTDNPKYKDKVKAALDTMDLNLAKTGLPYPEYAPEDASAVSKTMDVCAVMSHCCEGLIKSYIVSGDETFRDRAEKYINAAYENAYDTKYNLFQKIDVDTGKVVDHSLLVYGEEMVVPLILLGMVEEAETLFYSFLRHFHIYDWMQPEAINYETREYDAKYPQWREFRLRPEIVDAARRLYAATRNDEIIFKMQEYFLAMKRYCKRRFGYIPVYVDTNEEVAHKVQPSYFIAETLPGLYRLFYLDSHHLESILLDTWGMPIKGEE